MSNGCNLHTTNNTQQNLFIYKESTLKVIFCQGIVFKPVLLGSGCINTHLITIVFCSGKKNKKEHVFISDTETTKHKGGIF